MRPVSMRSPWSVTICLCLAGTLAGCSGDRSVEPPAPPTPPPSTQATDPGPLQVKVDKGMDLNQRPHVNVNHGQLPTSLTTQELIPGSGRTATAQDTVSVQYVGVLASSGQEFDSSWDTGQPATFSLATGVIPGFRNGIAGMKEGGRRIIIMPPDQAYGEQGMPTTIPPNATLVFVVDLIKIQ
jgi:peptidylprolyl isomerase